MNMNPVDLNGMLRESWQNSAVVECQIKVEVYDKQNKVVSLEDKEISVLSPKSTASTKASVLSSIEKNRPQAQLVGFIEGLPIKAGENINADQLTECSSDSDDSFTEPEEARKSLFRKISGDTINDESFAETKLLIQEEVDIKSEDEGSDQSNNKWHPTSNKTGSLTDLNQTGINSLHSRLVEPSVFKCFYCSYQTHREFSLSTHLRIHMDKTFKCLHCPYKTWKSSRLKCHQLIHTPKEEVELHKCPNCEFTSKQKKYVRNHLLVHKSLDEITWYQCPECPFKTKRKDTLKRSHMLKHMKDVPLHKCTLCSFESPRKINVQRHAQCVHKPKDVGVIECPEKSCLYKTHDKSNLTRHVRLYHKTNKIFKCSKCSYQTKHPGTLQKHKLKHENPDKWFSCPLCPYKTPYRASLTSHSLVHKSDNEIQWFHCSECSYKCKRKRDFKGHKLIHNRVAEKQFECSECCYKTAIAKYFRLHLVKHKDTDFQTWFKCVHCSYKTTRESNLKQHSYTCLSMKFKNGSDATRVYIKHP